MGYPNLELLSYIFETQLINAQDPNDRFIRDITVEVFPQIWPNSGGGMARVGYTYGQAMTQQYTTVLISRNQGVAMVCFDNKPAYFVNNLDGQFSEDLKNRNMKGVQNAMAAYGEKKNEETHDGE